jgi:hypothetical protein
MMRKLREKRPRGQVLLCGMGLHLSHLTLETLQALKKCQAVYHSSLDVVAVEHVRRLCSGAVVDLRGADKSVSASALDIPIRKAREGQSVAFLGYGHPLVLNSTSFSLLERCRSGKIPCRILAAISSIDELLIMIGDPAVHIGLQVYPSERVCPPIQLSPASPALIMQLDQVVKSSGGELACFLEQLKRLYPTSHPFFLLRCSRGPDAPPLRLRTDLRRLSGVLKKLSEEDRCIVSLYIPKRGGRAFSRRAV